MLFNAHDLIYKLKKIGIIKYPDNCQNCGKKPLVRSLHAHHDDYDKPHRVVFLCSKCHRNVHGNNPKTMITIDPSLYTEYLLPESIDVKKYV